MTAVLLCVGSFIAYLIAYHTYGRYLARKIFRLDDARVTPACALRDDHDFVPTNKEVLFGHHFTSIAGTGPIVGPALAVIWGWVPALVWVLLGSIFMGAVHDLSALVISARHQGRSIGDIARDLVNPRVRLMFLVIIFLTLLIVIAVFCLIIASLFARYYQAIFSIWIEIPIAMALGWAVYRKGWPALPLSLAGVALLYAAMGVGMYWPESWNFRPFALGSHTITPVVCWGVILLIYAYIASTLPVWRLLQPRDYINGHELFIAMGLLALGLLFARPEIVAPAVDLHPAGAPPMWPMLFITVACGAISGFHCLVSSGTSSKQLRRESDAQFIGYGSMITEGMLSVLVIIAVAAGLGMAVGDQAGGAAVWKARYASWGAAQGLKDVVGAFVDGSANMLTAIGIPLKLGVVIMGVFVASFAATTLDTATRLQRYIISELGLSVGLRALGNKHVATALAVATAGALALPEGKPGAGLGSGGLILWPLFGAMNQLLACLALLVATVYLRRTGRPIWVTLVPMLFMLTLTAWAMIYNLNGFLTAETRPWRLIVIGAATLGLEIWMVIESVIVLVRGRPMDEAEAEKAAA